MTDYVLGFMFSIDKNSVALIRKNKPKWQEGCLNGIGGKLEDYDASNFAAIVREFKEETGVDTFDLDWKPFAAMFGESFKVDCFRVFSDKVFQVKTVEEEVVGVFLVEDILTNQEHIISNLRWLIPLALDKSDSGGYGLIGTVY